MNFVSYARGNASTSRLPARFTFVNQQQLSLLRNNNTEELKTQCKYMLDSHAFAIRLRKSTTDDLFPARAMGLSRGSKGKGGLQLFSGFSFRPLWDRREITVFPLLLSTVITSYRAGMTLDCGPCIIATPFRAIVTSSLKARRIGVGEMLNKRSRPLTRFDYATVTFSSLRRLSSENRASRRSFRAELS